MLNPVCTVPILSWNKKDGQSSKFGKEIEDNFWITVGTPDRYSGRYIGGESVISRWCIGQLSVIYRSTVGDISVNCRWYIQFFEQIIVLKQLKASILVNLFTYAILSHHLF